MRTERLLASVVIAGMSAFTMWEAVAQTAPPVSAPAVLTPGSIAVELVKSLAWPLARIIHQYEKSTRESTFGPR